MTDLKVVHEVGALWQAGDSRVFRVPSGRAARRGSVGALSRSMFERPGRTLAGDDRHPKKSRSLVKVNGFSAFAG